VRNGGIRNETRSSALWGTGNRGGESRSSALWGKGGRGAITALAAMLVLATGAPSGAQAPGARPRRVQDTLTSPSIGADGRVTFQLYAPKATEVLLRSEGPAPFANQPLTKGDSGVWRLTAQLPADLYIYWFDVDGVAVADPRNNRPRVNMSTVRSLLEVPGATSEFFAERPVPHGQVAAIHYQSKALGVPRRMHVYTPPGYATSTQRYPVLYLLHGAGDNDQSWLMAGRANFILDNLIAVGSTQPMIVVMAYGYARRAGQPIPDLAGKPPGSPERAKAMLDMASAFEADVTEALIPFVDSTFRTTADRDHRAMAGLSMGGMQTFHVTLRHLDLFSYIGGFSGAGAAQMLAGEKLDARTAYNGAFADPEAFAKKVRLLWLGVGTEEPERMRDGIRGLHASLTEAKIPHVYWESPGTDHEWQTWRRDLKDFAPRLFRPAAR